jgi:hypothetical protein
MGEAKRRRERLGEWYGKPITTGHPDAPKPKQPQPIPVPAPELTVPERIEHEMTNVQEREDAPQGTPVASEYITRIDPAIPGSDRTVVTVHRPNQSPAYRRANRIAGFAMMALLGCVLGVGTSIAPSPHRKLRER